MREPFRASPSVSTLGLGQCQGYAVPGEKVLSLQEEWRRRDESKNKVSRVGMRAKRRPPLEADAQEKELLARMRAGDERAYDEFADIHVAGLYRFAFGRLGRDRELALEIVQTTMCKVIAKLDTYRGEAPLRTWLCAICRNEIAGHYRRKAIRPVEVELEPTSNSLVMRSGDLDPEARLVVSEAADMVHQALDDLPAHYSRALQWKYLDGLSARQIAARLELSTKGAESLLARARDAFRSAHSRLARGSGPASVFTNPPGFVEAIEP